MSFPRKRLIVTIAALAAVGVGAAFWQSTDSQAEDTARKAIEASLGDPNVTAFRNLVSIKAGKGRFFCVGGDVEITTRDFHGYVPFIVVMAPGPDGKLAPVDQVMATNRPGVLAIGSVHDNYECNLPPSYVPRLQR